MARKTRTTRTTRTTSSNFFTTGDLSRFSFWIVIIIGICMLVIGVLNLLNRFVNIWGWLITLVSIVQRVCFLLGMFVPIILSFRAAHHRGRSMFWLWLVCVILVIIGVVLDILGAVL